MVKIKINLRGNVILGILIWHTQIQLICFIGDRVAIWHFNRCIFILCKLFVWPNNENLDLMTYLHELNFIECWMAIDRYTQGRPSYRWSERFLYSLCFLYSIIDFEYKISSVKAHWILQFTDYLFQSVLYSLGQIEAMSSRLVGVSAARLWGHQ